MLIPSIDLMDGKIVSMVHGEQKALEFDDFEHWIKVFEKYPLVQVVDLDAVFEQGHNHVLVEKLTSRLTCQVGGGIRNAAMAKEALERGAKRVILGSALFREGKVDVDGVKRLMDEVGRQHLVFAVDARAGIVAVSGWKKSTGIAATDAMQQLEPYCTAFLYTHIDTEGMMSGFPSYLARDLRSRTKRQLMVAGGIRSLDEVTELDTMEVDAVVGMAIYSGAMQA